MPNFGVKSILRGDIITLVKWFSNSKKICEYLTFRGVDRMSYVHVPVGNLDQKRSVKGEIPIKGYIYLHAK